MSAKDKLRKAKGRKEKDTFILIPKAVLNSPAYLSLSHFARSLLIELVLQYNGFNNGALNIGWHRLRDRGWASQATLQKAKCELAVETVCKGRLIHGAGLILQTRGYSKGRVTLYALTWLPIDDCKGQHDFKATRVPPGQWRDFKNKNHLHGMKSCSSPHEEVDSLGLPNRGPSSPPREEVKAKNTLQPLHGVKIFVDLPRSLRLPALQY